MDFSKESWEFLFDKGVQNSLLEIPYTTLNPFPKNVSDSSCCHIIKEKK